MLWSTGEVGGASGVTMAERTREGGCRTSGGRFSIPPGTKGHFLRRDCRNSSRLASAHQRKATLHETNRPIAQIGGFAGVLGTMFGAEQNFSDHAASCRATIKMRRVLIKIVADPVSIAAHSCIACGTSQRQSLTPLGRQSAEGRTRRLAIERTP